MTGPPPAPAVRVEQVGPVVTLTMDRPGRRNALSAEMVEGLAAGIADAAGAPGARVIVLTHAGPAFCAGADLRATAGERATGTPPPDFAAVLVAIQRSPLPVVARIAGHCMGGGVGLAAACDISVAAAEARFGFTEVRIGVAPAIIAVVCLPKLRRADALDLFLGGERITAQRAAEVGLITRWVEPDRLDAEVAEVVARLLRGGPVALAAAKQLVYEVPARSQTDAFAWAGELSASLFAGPEAAEGRQAFLDKRPPQWSPGDG